MTDDEMRDVVPATFVYKNHRGEIESRHVKPKGIWFGATVYHLERQWFLAAFDLDRQARRDFAMAGISDWSGG